MTGRGLLTEEALRGVLAECGATGAAADTLLRYNDRPSSRGALRPTTLPLDDEDHLRAWRLYAEDARSGGAIASLRRRFFQLQFPIEEGISQSTTYREAVLRGMPPDEPAAGLPLERPDLVDLVIHPTIGGAVPIIVAGTRADFVTLLRAFASRNEPRPVPDSMGASMISGLNNWDRIGRHRHGLEARLGRALGDEEWTAAFQELRAKPAVYRDRFILLGRGAYGGTPASEAGLPENEWLQASHSIRMNHEATHYVVARVLGEAASNVHDELVADLVGLWATFGRYDLPLALRILGLSALAPHPRRIHTYLGKPPIEGAAQDAVEELLRRAASNLGLYLARCPPPDAVELGRLAIAITSLRLEVLASTDFQTGIDIARRTLEADHV